MNATEGDTPETPQAPFPAIDARCAPTATASPPGTGKHAQFRRDSSLRLLFKRLDHYATDPNQLEILAEEIFKTFFRDDEPLAAGGTIVHQIGPRSGSTYTFTCRTICAASDTPAEKMPEQLLRFAETFPQQAHQEAVASSGGAATISNIVPIFLSPDAPIGFFWATVDTSQAQEVLDNLLDAAALMSALLCLAKTRYALREISSSTPLAGSGSREELASHTADSCLRALPCDTVAIWGVEPDRQLLRTMATASHSGRQFSMDMPLGSGAVAGCVTRKMTCVVNDLLDPAQLQSLGLGPIYHESLLLHERWRSAIFLPLATGESAIGVLAAYAQRRAAFSTLDIEIGTLLAQKFSAEAFHRQQLAELQEIQRRLTADPAVSFGLLAMERIHDVANRLASAQSSIGNIRSALLTLKQPRLVRATEAASEAVDAAYRILRQVRSLTSHQPAQFVPTELRSILQPLLEAATTRAEAAGVALELKCPRGIVVSGDPQSLQRAFWNLLDNSLHWLQFDMKGRRKVVRITAKKAPPKAVVSIWDNGPGIAPHDVARAFDYRFTTKGDRGLGLGLPSAKRIVEAHQGTIMCSSKWGYHTEFQVCLPLAA